MPRTVAPRTATRGVLNRVSHRSLATIPEIRGGTVTATGGTLLGRREMGASQRKVLPPPAPVSHKTDVLPLVGPVEADEVVDLVVGVDRLAGVAPQPLRGGVTPAGGAEP